MSRNVIVEVGAAAPEVSNIVDLASNVSRTFEDRNVQLEIAKLTLRVYAEHAPGGLDANSLGHLQNSGNVRVRIVNEIDLLAAIRDVQALAANLGREVIELDFNGVSLNVSADATSEALKETYLAEVCVPGDRTKLKGDPARSWSKAEACVAACVVSNMLGTEVTFETFGLVGKANPGESIETVSKRFHWQ